MGRPPLRFFLALLAALPLVRAGAGQPAAPRLFLAFSSFRDRPLHPRVYYYDWDGRGGGRLAGGIEPVNLRVETHPSLARAGRLCACASEFENNPSDLRVWDTESGKELGPFAGLNTEAVELGAALSADGNWLAGATWRREGGPAGWNLLLYSLQERKVVDLPVSTDDDELQPSLSGDGRLIAFVSNRPPAPGEPGGLSDIYLFDRVERRMRSLPGLNTRFRELDPALSADGKWLAFTSNRSGGQGNLDIYLYDLDSTRLVPLPGLNGPGLDQTPALSPDGRFLTFVSERSGGTGERDIYLFERASGRLAPTPNLNSSSEDFDPSITYR
jgi:Tol biopolymer transport system component